MKASQIDRSRYLRGLLVLIGKDRVVDPDEHALVLQFGRMLDFDIRFCEAAMADLLTNEHITDDPVVFDEPEIAACFLRDALRAALADREIHAREFAWLEKVARANGIPDAWMRRESRRLRKTKFPGKSPGSFEIRRFL